jgi:cytochrome c oxidase subunit 2
MKKSTEIAFYGISTAVVVALSFWLGHKAYSWMPPAATAEAERVDDLFSFLVWLGSIIFLGVTSMIGFALLTCRAERGDFTEGHAVRHNATIEIIWTAIPTLLIALIALRSIVIYNMLDIDGLQLLITERRFPQLIQAALAQPAPPPQDVNRVEVMARQFSWSFRYPEANVTSTELHLPVDQPVQFALASEDVLHGFFVPEFRLKQDMVPGQLVDLVLTPILKGSYTLRDSQLSGTYFALMKARVVIESPDDYRQWLTQAAAHAPEPAPNLAVDEYAHPRPALLGRSAQTTVPKAPPLVNYHG